MNIPIYFCNIDIKHLKHTFATCSFSANIFLLLWQMEAHRRVEVTGVLAGDAELTGNTELGSVAERARWGGMGGGAESRWRVAQVA
jgi:hypothetical protein